MLYNKNMAVTLDHIGISVPNISKVIILEKVRHS